MKSATILFLAFMLLFASGGLEYLFDFISNGIIFFSGCVIFAVMGIYSQLKDSYDKEGII